MKISKYIVIAVTSLIIGVLLASSCEREPKTTTITKTRVVKVKDTLFITDTIVKPKTVYVNKYNTDIVYLDKPDSIPVIKANKYIQRIKGNRSVADIEVTTTGELLDLKAFVEVTDSIVEKETIIIKNKSNLFLSGGINMQPNQAIRDFNVGLDYNIKNKVLIGVNGGYDLNINQPYIGLRVGISL